MASAPSWPLGVREIREADTTVGSPAPTEAEVRAAYRLELAAAIRRRLGLAAAIFLLCIAAASAAEHWFHPERSPAVWVVFGVYAAAWGMGLAIARVPQLVAHVRWVAAGLAVVVSLAMSGYAHAVHGELELFTMGQLCLLFGLAAFVPWGWRPQLVVVAVASLGLSIAAPALTHTLHPAYCVIAGVTGVVISVAGATFLERAAFAEFLRSALLVHASSAQREEADVSGALFRVAQALHAQLDQEDVVPRVTRLAVDVLGCDDCWLYLKDERRGTFRLRAHSGSMAEAVARIGDVEFAGDFSLFALARPGALSEIPDTDAQRLVSRPVLRTVACGALLALPISLGATGVGMLFFCWRRRGEVFGRREHRLAFGIAHAAAVAIENARLVAEITASSRLKSEFLSTMSHELRTPLNVICGYSDILAEGGFGPLDPEQWRAVAGIRRSTRNLIELIDAGADLQRLEGGDAPVATVVDLDELFAEVRRDLGAVDTTVVALRWKNGLGGLGVATDRAKLKTILKHLVGNALKFTAKGEVSVAVAETPGALVVRVRDTGIGIPSEHLTTIFEMFRQVDASETRRFGGAGLGLHIVARLVQRLGGTVAVDSTPGAGSTFTVTLPVGPAAT